MDKEFDVFQWANAVDEVKNNVSVELFLFNKNYTPYKVRYSDGLTQSVKAMFMLEAINYVIKEADKGLECRDYELSDGEDKVIYKVGLEKVGRAETLIHLIENEYKDIAFFTDNEHEFKRIKGILAKFSYPGEDGQKVFYIAKGIAASSALKGKVSWELNGETLEPLTADIAIKMPEANETAIIDGMIVIFNQSKFEKLFQYDYKSQVISEQKAKELMDAYGLSFPEGLTLNALLEDKKPLVKKLQGIEVGEMKQDQLLEYADEMRLELMTDDQEKIIIMDDKDLGMFVNLLNEDYFVSPVNGKRYEIKSKKLLDEPDGEPPRG
ncbi:MAG: Kiwa anti-phage protein KwaB-like domain-containing protein [Candidatus Saccharimonadales bacterium]